MTSSSLADTQLVDVKGGVVVDANSAEAGKMYLDVNGESKTSQIDTLGHEVLETQDYQGKGRGLVFKNTEDQQEALGNVFGAQLADRINQAAGGDLDSTGGANFNQKQLVSNSVAQGTHNANKVGNAEVDHRQLYAKEVAAIKNVSKQYAEDNGISQNSAEKALGDNLRYYIDKDFQTKAKANGFVPDNAALNYLAGALNGEDYISNPSDLPIVDSNYSKEETLAGLKNYGETSSTAFNDRTIGAKPLVGDATWLTGDDKAVRDYYDEHNPRDASVIPQLGGEVLALTHGLNAGIGNVAQGLNDLATSPLDTSKQAANGFMNTLEALKHPEEMFAESNKGNIEAELDRRDIFGANSFDAGYHQGQSDVKAIATAAEIVGVLAPEVYLGKMPKANTLVSDAEKNALKGSSETRTKTSNILTTPDVNIVTSKSVAKSGETLSTAIGKEVHKEQANIRRESGQFSIVEQPIKATDGSTILVPKRIDLKTGEAQTGTNLQQAIPDAVNFDQRLIVDDKPLGHPLAKDRQEIIRFINAFKEREGVLPETIGIQRYDPQTGLPVKTDLYGPYDFLPKKK